MVMSRRGKILIVLQHARAARPLALFALVLLAGCAGQRITPAPAVSVRTPAHTTPRETQPASRRTGITPKEVGHYLDALQGRLLQEVPKDVGVVRQGERIAVGIPTATDAARLQQTLRSIATVLIEYRLVLVTVRSTPAAGETQDAAERRAQDAARTLIRRGMAAGRINVLGGALPSVPPHLNLFLEPIIQSDSQPADH